MQTVTLGIKGMTCLGCVNSVKTVLENLPGVTRVEVTLDPGQTTIQYDPASIGLKQLKETIIEAGFEVTG